ncbi:MAG: GntR family transcriptional regulator [Parvibaculaceae bacterium]
MRFEKKGRCYETIKAKILTLEFAPGSILDETVLSKQFGVSRTPLREILQRLAGEGYVTLEKNRGAIVSSMNLAVMRDFFQTAPMIYATVSRLAAEKATREEIVSLKAVQKQFRQAVAQNNPGEMVRYNHTFHELIGEIASNPYLSPSLGRLLIDHTRSSQIFYRPRDRKDAARISASCDQHDELILSFEKRDPARAVEITLKHWDLSRNLIELYVLADPLPIDPTEPVAKRRVASGRRVVA